ncbi:MAG: outer membrane protein assembly factor BamD [Treponema sp.]|nr:outer membrane protein assembly factor BamD [Treponema sp.]
MVKLKAAAGLACGCACLFFPAFSHAAAVYDRDIPVELVSYESGELEQVLAEGLDAYNSKDFANATILLREALAGEEGNSDVHYMLIMSEMYCEDYASVISDCTDFAASYPDSPLVPNVNYQKGKALHYKGDNDQAVMVLSDFCHENPRSPMYPSALYWIAECFYEDYNFTMAEGLFQRIIDVYPNDKKALDAKYKVDAIAQREREQKLLDLLKANNERFLEQQASYERQLKGMESSDLATLRKELDAANARIAELERQLAQERALAEAERKAADAARADTAAAKAERDAALSDAASYKAESDAAKEQLASYMAEPAMQGAESTVSSSAERVGITEQELLELKLRASQLQRMLDERSSASRDNKAD